MPSLLDDFGTPQERLLRGVNSLRRSSGVLVVDDDSRENEGDLIFPAMTLTTEQMAMLIRECSGIVCLCLTAEKAESLKLHPMVEENTSAYGTAFTISIEAATGVTTGVSAADRVRTIHAAVAPSAVARDLRHPGHVFPLVARRGGVLERDGHTEATVDLMKISGLAPYGVLCELTNADGSMARLKEVCAFGKKHGFPVLSVADIILWRRTRNDIQSV